MSHDALRRLIERRVAIAVFALFAVAIIAGGFLSGGCLSTAADSNSVIMLSGRIAALEEKVAQLEKERLIVTNKVAKPKQDGNSTSFRVNINVVPDDESGK